MTTNIINNGMISMANMACHVSASVNGVAALHTDLMKSGIFQEFNEMYPNKINNKTNGVTQRRWLMLANPKLARILDRVVGEDWVTELSETLMLNEYQDCPKLHKLWKAMKNTSKDRVRRLIKDRTGVEIDTNAMLDVQVKRIHEYKRQLLNVMHAIHLHNEGHKVNRVKVIGGKAAPGYHVAKRIISLINRTAHEVQDEVTLVFLPNYNVSAMEVLSAGADLSEQISTAGYEASGTGNMKFMANGALTMGTMDGANVEMYEELGHKDMFVFGMNAEEVDNVKSNGYNPHDYLTPELEAVINKMREWGYDDLVNIVMSPEDQYLTAADFTDYINKQEEAQNLYDNDKTEWTRQSIRQTANVGKFSTDRTMRDYNRDIWHLETI